MFVDLIAYAETLETFSSMAAVNKVKSGGM